MEPAGQASRPGRTTMTAATFATNRKRRPLLLALPGIAIATGALLFLPNPAHAVAARAKPKSIFRLNQTFANVEKGIALPVACALKKGGKEKIAFLTFDDGPSPVTNRVLAILEKNGIRATFFVIGKMASEYPDLLKKEYDAGHAIGNHSYTHVYKKIYQTPWTMIEEIQQTEAVFEKVLGPHFRTSVFRFPGGYMGKRSVFHGGKARYSNALKDCGMNFIDWNVDSEDAAPTVFSAKQLASHVLGQATGQNRIVVLMHDAGSKDRTADALPTIIAGLKKRGYVFRTLE
jgi:peptidoglycan/xylan/chitin deacetylase (PgdA/CDA1 family)